MTLRAHLAEALHTALAVLANAADPTAVQGRALLMAQASMKAAGGEDWAEPDPALPRLERQAIADLLALWGTLELATLKDLGLAELTALEGAGMGYRFSAIDSLTKLLMNGEAFVAAAGSAEGPLVQRAYAAWLRGVINAEAELAAPVAIPTNVREAYRAALRSNGLRLVRDGTIRTYREAIVDKLVSGEFDGLGPRDVARKLRAQFGAGRYNWVRLARSEIAQAQVLGKREQYLANGIERVDYLTARDSLVSAICRELARNGPYDVATAPVPVRDSHPNCRCSWRPVLED